MKPSLLTLLALAACGGGGGATADAGPPDAISGPEHTFIVSDLALPLTSGAAPEFGLDVDGQAPVDNAMGVVFGTFTELGGVDFDVTARAGVTSGEHPLLLSLRADSLSDDPAVLVRFLDAQALSSPAFDGNDMPVPTTAAGQLVGSITGGALVAGPGEVTLPLHFLPPAEGDAVLLPVHHAWIRASVDATGCMNGILGGALDDDTLMHVVAPAMTARLAYELSILGPAGPEPCSNGGPACPMTPDGRTTSCDVQRGRCYTQGLGLVMGQYDADVDGAVSEDELWTNSLTQNLIARDLDLLPAPDGHYESLSFGIKLGCAPAMYSAP